jgi:hypothetical protein
MSDDQGFEREIRSPLVRQVLDYWAGKRGGRAFPARRDIDPLEFRFALGQVSLIDVLYQPLRFRYRLVSTTLTWHLGYEMTGKMTDAIPEPDVRDYVTSRYVKVVEGRQPLYEYGDTWLDRRLWHYEALYLPLSGDGQIIDMLMACRITDQPRPSPRPVSIGGMH